MNKDISKIKFFITGGGTGGHIYPAVSIIEELLFEGAERENIFYIGNKKNLEAKIAKERGYNFLSTSVFGMPRKFSFKFISFGFHLFISVLKCFYFALEYRPNVVFATGGYVCAPVLFVSKILKIPYVLHDSDCYPGITTRSFAGGAFSVNLAFIEAAKYIKSEKINNFKNPIRREFFKVSKDEARKMLGINNEFLILIMGGSQGAKSINNAALRLIKEFKNKDGIKIILQTGRKNYDEIVSGFQIPDNARIEPYFDDMSVPILAADLIVSRAGSISISEILSAKNPSILVPYPYAAADHQRINAKAISNQNAALYIEDDELENALIPAVSLLLNDAERYNDLKNNAGILGSEFAFGNKKIIELILKAAKC